MHLGMAVRCAIQSKINRFIKAEKDQRSMLHEYKNSANIVIDKP